MPLTNTHLSLNFCFAILVANATIGWFPQSTIPIAGAADPITNGDLKAWNQNTPLGWTFDIGASQGAKTPESTARALDGGGVRLSGDKDTRAWLAMQQSVSLTAGQTYQLEFTARAINVRRDPGQFNNCFVGVIHYNAQGKRLAIQVKDFSKQEDFKNRTLSVSPPPNTSDSKVMFFLSKSGAAELRSVSLTPVQMDASFDLLLDALRESYSFTELKQVDWDDLDRQYRPAAQAAKTPDAWIAAVRPMLAQLRDIHVSIETPGGKRIPTSGSRYTVNYRHSAMRSSCKQLVELAPIGWIAKRGKAGVLVINSLPEDGPYDRLKSTLANMKDVDRWCVDLRACRGGNELRGQQVAGHFTRKKVLYARSKRRQRGKLVEAPERLLLPRKPFFGGRVACLLGPGCVSSGEGLAMMFDAIDGVRTFGQATRGASGNPRPVDLPGGVRVWFSRWLAMQPDGTVIEGRGIVPDETVEHFRGGDATFEQAIGWLDVD